MRIGLTIAAIMVISVFARGQDLFTYQGLLTGPGGASSGAYDFRFRLYTLSLGGEQLGPQLCRDDVSVVAGRFTTDLDFGPVFAGQSLFLEIDVRAGEGVSCVSNAGFVTLGDRQLVARTPQASFAARAGDAQTLQGLSGTFYRSAANLTGLLNPGVLPAVVARRDEANVFAATCRFDGSVLIGRSGLLTGADRFHIGNAIGQDGYVGMYVSSDQITGLPFYGYSTPTGRAWTLMSGNSWRVHIGGFERVAVTDTGRMGIGTVVPASTLDVRGDIAMGTAGELQAAAGAEKVRILRGRTLQGGGVFFGSGFTCARLATGFYRLTFTSAFAATPTVTANAVGTVARTVTIGGTTTTTADIYVFTPAGATADADVMVQVIGPR